jgi:hypothetical protein
MRSVRDLMIFESEYYPPQIVIYILNLKLPAAENRGMYLLFQVKDMVTNGNPV